jgi:hypothetical protein
MKDKKEFAVWLVIAVALATLFKFEIIDEVSTGLAMAFFGALRGFLWQKDKAETYKTQRDSLCEKLNK